MKRLKKHLLAVALLITLGLGLSLWNGLRPIAKLQPAANSEPQSTGTTPVASLNQLEDKSKPTNMSSKTNITRGKSLSVNIKQWGLESWSRVRRKLQRPG